jgi:hypothetical protein
MRDSKAWDLSPTPDGPERKTDSIFYTDNHGGNTPVWTVPPDTVTQPKRPERYCFFLDIDGTLLRHYGDNPKQYHEQYDDVDVLPKVREFFSLCGKQGHVIILTSGRRESFRELTEKQLRNARIPFDQLILGCTNAIRILVNDTKPYRKDNPVTAIAFNLERDEGIQKLVDFLKEN